MGQLVLLHGALGSAAQLESLKGLLAAEFKVYTLNFEGHGGNDSTQPFSIDLFVKNISDFLEENGIGSCSLFGYSMGGYVALKWAAQFPERVERVMTLGTKFEWTPEIAMKETAMLHPEKIEEKVPKFAAVQAALHAPSDWKKVMNKTAEMMRELGDQPALTKTHMNKITVPALLCLGSEDNMVSREETHQASGYLPLGIVHIIPDLKHPIEQVDLELLSETMSTFFKN